MDSLKDKQIHSSTALQKAPSLQPVDLSTKKLSGQDRELQEDCQEVNETCHCFLDKPKDSSAPTEFLNTVEDALNLSTMKNFNPLPPRSLLHNKTSQDENSAEDAKSIRSKKSDKIMVNPTVSAQNIDAYSALDEEENEIEKECIEFPMGSRKRTVSFGFSIRPFSPTAQVPKRKVTLPGKPNGGILKKSIREDLIVLQQVPQTMDPDIPTRKRAESNNPKSFKIIDNTQSYNKALSPAQRNRTESLRTLPRILDVEQTQENNIENSFDVFLPRNELDRSRNIGLNTSNIVNTIPEDNNIENSVAIDINESHGAAEQENIEEEGNLNQDNVEERTRELEKILKRHAKYKLRRAFAVCLTIFLTTFFLEPLIEGTSTSYKPAFMVAYAFLIYYFIENIIKTWRHDILPWKMTENFFDTLDIGILLGFLTTIDLRLSGFNIVTKFMFFAPLLSTLVYYCKSKAPKALRESQTAIRGLFALQIVLLAGKVDGDLNWPWRAIISFAWLYLGLIGIYCVVVGITMLCVIVLASFNATLYENVSKKIQVVGFLWSCLYSGFAIVMLLALGGVTIAFDENNSGSKDLLKNSVLAARYLSACLGAFTILCYRWVLEFLAKFNLDESDYRAELGLMPEDDTLPTVVREKRDTYLVMLSSTYFLSLKNSFFTKGKNLKKMKNAARQAKKKKFKNNYEKKLDNIKLQIRRKGTITIDTLKQEKQGLDEVFGRRGSKIDIIVDDERPRPRSRSRQFSVVLGGNEVHIWTKRERKESSPSLGPVSKVCLSEGDIPYSLESPRTIQKIDDDNENLCYICCAKPADAVIIECGHGGICCDCAIETIKTKGQCMECRKEVSQIIKICPDPKMKNIIKGYETIKITPGKAQNEA